MFGSAIYAFEGIGLILPMENCMLEPQRIGSVVNVGMVIIASLYLAFAFVGYWVFGASTETAGFISV